MVTYRLITPPIHRHRLPRYVKGGGGRSSTNNLHSHFYSIIGFVLLEQHDLDGALKHFQRALDIDLHAPEPDQLKIATDYNNIASVLMDQFQHMNALKIFLDRLPPRHVTYIKLSVIN